jgi:hypothetical protein
MEQLALAIHLVHLLHRQPLLLVRLQEVQVLLVAQYLSTL